MPEADSHPAVTQAPKNLRESLERVAEFLKSGRQSTSYSYLSRSKEGPKNCVIGQFFTPDQLEYIRLQGLNRASVKALTRDIGAENLMAMTHLNVDQAWALQDLFDRGVESRRMLLNSVQEVLLLCRPRINNIEFRL